MLNRFIGGATIGCVLAGLAGLSIAVFGPMTFPGCLVIFFIGSVAGIAAAIGGAGEGV